MFYHHIVVFVRNIKKSGSTFLINLVGLTTALTCSLLIYLWIDDETSVDKFFDNEETLYQVLENTTTPQGIQTTEQTPQILSEKIADAYPEIAHAATATPTNWFPKFILSAEEKLTKASGKFVGKDFFNVFHYELIAGVASSVLGNRDAIILSETTAKKLFGSVDDAVGKTITWKIPGMQNATTVTGIFSDIPSSASDKFDFVLSFDFLRDKLNLDMRSFDYGPSTFITLRNGINVPDFNDKIGNFIKREDPNQAGRKLFIAKYSDLYLHASYENGIQSGGRITYVKLFASIAIFILVIACINFMNLATAKAASSVKNVGIRKVNGAKQGTLISQFLTESLLMSMISLLLAIGVAYALLEPFSLLTKKHLHIQTHLLLPFVMIAMVTGLIAGSYPAFYLSRFTPMNALKDKRSASFPELAARKGLVVFQFSISIVFIVCVAVGYRQTQFIQKKNLGYNKDNILLFDAGPGTMQNIESLIAELKNTPGVINASTVWGNLVGNARSETVAWEGMQLPFASMAANYDFLGTLGIRFAEGRAFSENIAADNNAIIFNKKAIAALGIADPLNKVINFQGQQVTIIGVTEDFHFESLYSPVKPLFIRLQKDRSWTIVARIADIEKRQTLSRIEALYRRHNSGLPLEYRFLDDDYQQRYETETRVTLLSRYFAALATVISSLGLLGLATFTAERRRKEIGIRKVLGATAGRIVVLITGEFLMLVGLAFLVGTPLAYWITTLWLSGFAYHIELQSGYFFFAAAVALIVAFASVGVQALRASHANPAEVLKHE